MARRAKNYESDVAVKIRSSPEYAEHYIRSAMLNHDDTLGVALANAIDQYGHAELAEKLEKPASNITRTVKNLRESKDIKVSSLYELLGCFGIVKSKVDILILDNQLSNQLSIEISAEENTVWNEYEVTDMELEYGT